MPYIPKKHHLKIYNADAVKWDMLLRRGKQFHKRVSATLVSISKTNALLDYQKITIYIVDIGRV